MPFRRRYRPRRKRHYRRRKAYVSKKAKFGIVKSLNNNGFHQFKETFSQKVVFNTDNRGKAMWTPVLGGTGFGQESGGVWSLNQIETSQMNAYKALFSQYRITGIRMKIFPGHNVSNVDSIDTLGESTYSEKLPRLYLKTDYAKTENAADWGSFLSRNPKCILFNKPLTVWLKPRVQTTVTQDTDEDIDVTNMRSVVARLQRWCNTVNMDIFHGGVKIGLSMSDVPSATNISFDAVTTYYFQLKKYL